ncbi:hypothetical protein HK102_006358, partial [Quaeritorhiza haematococci]
PSAQPPPSPAMFSVSSIVTLFLAACAAHTAYAQEARTVPDCPAPVQIDCLISQSQYTVLGTIVSTTQQNASSNIYNATMRIQCVYGSFSNPPSTLLPGDSVVTTTNWGSPRPACPNNGGATARVNETNVYFLYISTRPRANELPTLSVFDICNGGFAPTQSNLEKIYVALNDNPRNRVLAGSNCSLPTPTSLPDRTQASSSPTSKLLDPKDTGLALPGAGAFSAPNPQWSITLVAFFLATFLMSAFMVVM